MRRLLTCLVAVCTVIPIALACSAKAQPQAQPQEKRIALVIGNAAYGSGPLKTSANDAGLIAQTLQAGGFDVVGARDLDEEALRRALREFLNKAASSGPDTVAFIYLSGYGLQLEGENYFLPIDAKIARAPDVAAQALRVSDYIRPLASLKLKASIVVLDAARRNPFTISGDALAGGLALVEPGPGTLVAFNGAPGTIAPDEDGSYGAYAQALSEMMREGGLSLAQVFERVRLRVSDMTKGAELPWFSSRIQAAFLFFERAPDAPAPIAATVPDAEISSKPIGELPVADAYQLAIERDTLQGYEEFLAAYPDDPLASRVRAILAARREALTWQRTYVVNTPNAYWSYLRRYPHGPHSADARRRLALGAFALEPPAAFDLIDYDVPPPPADEETYVDRPALAFGDVDLGFVPPPPLPVYFLPPPPPELVILPPPLPAAEEYFLPEPVFIPLPVWCEPPAYVVPPANNVILSNIHNTIIVDRQTHGVTIRNRRGELVSSERTGREPGGLEPVHHRAGAHDAGAFQRAGLRLSAPLPHSLATRAPIHANPSSAASLGPEHTGKLHSGGALPGMHGQPLPPLPGNPALLSAAPTHTSRDAHARPLPGAGIAPSAPVNRPMTATARTLPPLPDLRPGRLQKSIPPQQPLQTSPANTAPRLPSAALPARAPSPTIAAAPAVPRSTPLSIVGLHPPSGPAAPYRPPSPPAVHTAPSAMLRPASPPPVVHAAPPPVLRPPSAAPAVRAVAPPFLRPPAPPVVHAAPAPAFRPPAPPVVHAAPAPAFRPPAPPVVRAAPAPAFRPPAPAARPPAPAPAAARSVPGKRS